MEFDNSWEALFSPGEATKFFDLASLPKFQFQAKGYSKANAWWLSEVSSLIYKRESGETRRKIKGPTRNNILKKVNLKEVHFYSKKGTQCSIIEPIDPQNKKFVIVVFRGTDDIWALRDNLKLGLVSWPQGGKVHKGFKIGLNRVWPDINKYLKNQTCPVFYTGHSLGAALATLAASKRPPHAVYTFGSPRVGNKEFVKIVKNIKIFRVVNNRDFATTIPSSSIQYTHVGKLYYIAHNNRMFINPKRTKIALDRLKRDETLSETTNKKKLLSLLPENLADHAPVNYVAHLERHL
jgi:triacylglycerol lipase